MTRDVVNAMRRFWKDAFNGRDLTLLADRIADACVDHAALPGAAGRAAVLERLWDALRCALRDRAPCPRWRR